MSTDLLSARLEKDLLIFDGAMGTELYRKNFFVNVCFENLVISSADTVQSIHQSYIDSGCDVLTTNTFSANANKLSRFGLADKLQEICESELKPRNLANRSSATHEGSPLQKTAEKLGIETFSSATTSDWMRITCDAIKMGPGDSNRSHRKDEYVTVEEIAGGIEKYIQFIISFGDAQADSGKDCHVADAPRNDVM